MAPPLIISGVPGGWTQGATAPPRLEINDLIKNKMQWSLYVQAIMAMQASSQDDLISHFQLGGIHGLPYVQWDDSGDSQPVQGSGWSGYCTHGSVLFPTWHRPYVALYEQVMQNHAMQIASTATNGMQDWQQAANQLRAPYWDWAINNAVPPAEVISDQSITILGLDGQNKTVQNPLFGYIFHPVDQTFPAPYNVWPSTLRHATDDSSDAQSNVQELISDMKSEARNIRSSTYRLLTLVHTWPGFSNHSPGDGGSSSSSLEAVHDGIHVDVGGDGYMADPAVAALDPIFFLHHCNVDRLLALWQAVNPDMWVTQGNAEDGSFALAAGSQVDGTTDLAPFWNSAQSYWNSNETVQFTNLGYTYPEFVGLNLGDKDAVKSTIAAKINQLYAGAKPSVPPPFTTLPSQPKVPTSQPQAPQHPQNPSTAPSAPAAHAPSTVPSAHTPSTAPSAPAPHPPAQQGQPAQQHHGGSLFDQILEQGQTILQQGAKQAHDFLDEQQKAHPGEGWLQQGMHRAQTLLEQQGVQGQGQGQQAHQAQQATHPAGGAPAQPPVTVQSVPPPSVSQQNTSGAASVSHQPAHNAYDWVARVRAQKFELGTSFSVLIFIGDVPSDPHQWRSAPSYVGSHKAFVNTAASQCGNCRNQSDIKTEGFVHLDGWLNAHAGLPSLDPEVVEPYLTKNIHWRIQKANRQVVPTADLKSLQVDVLSTPMEPGHFFPKHSGDATHHHTITSGRQGGHAA